MYDELARAQRPGNLERFVVNALIPSVVLTFALHEPSAAHASLSLPTYPSFSAAPFVFVTPVCNPLSIDFPDVFPILVSMPHVVHPAGLRREGEDGRVVLKALVSTWGRARAGSVLVLHASDSRLIEPARRALLAARFRPAWSHGNRVSAWITIAIDFSPE